MTTFDKLAREVQRGIDGDNESLTCGFPKLGRYADFRKRIMMLIFSSTGAGKSSLVDDMMLNACESMIQKQTKKKAKFILFSMERAKHIRIAKWISRKVFQDQGIVIEVPKLLGWWKTKMTSDEHDLFLMYKDYADLLLEDYIDIYEGARNPYDIHKIMKEFFNKHGEYEQVTQYKKIYHPKDEDMLFIPIIDHGNLTRTNSTLPSKKQAIDDLVGKMQGFRDLEGASPVWIAQVKREMSSLSRSKDGEFELGLDDVKESGDVGDACDLAISLFDPAKFKQSSKTMYDPNSFVDKHNGAKYFRSIQINKSSYGEDDIRIPMAFNGFCGSFKELPKFSDLKEHDRPELVKAVLDKSYFLQK